MKGEKGGLKPKGPDIGLRQARRLSQLPEHKRLAFIAEGLPTILESAQGFWRASKSLREHPREASVLEGFAEEEAAKILILMDIVRCPPKLVGSRLGKLIGWFYDHMARLIYAEATKWRPMHLAQLRDYVDRQRRGHYIEGQAGEYIMPNWAMYERESLLYADVECYQDGALGWNAPRAAHRSEFMRDVFTPPTLEVAVAMQQVGLFTRGGLQATSEIWGSLEYKDKEDHLDGQQLTERLLTRLHDEGLIMHTAEKAHVAALYNEWQIPMYNLEFSLIPVTLADLEAEQEREYWSMAGDPR